MLSFSALILLWFSQTLPGKESNDLKSDTCRCVVWHASLVRYGKEEWDDNDLLLTVELAPVQSTNAQKEKRKCHYSPMATEKN